MPRAPQTGWGRVGRVSRRGIPSARNVRRTRLPNHVRETETRVVRFVGSANRKSLLLGTALASTLVFSSLAGSTPALAVDCPQNPPFSPDPIIFSADASITCINTDIRTGAAFAINLSTPAGVVDGPFAIYLNNSGALSATANEALGIRTATDNDYSSITIINSNAVMVTSLYFGAYGISSVTSGDHSPTSIVNSGGIVITGTQGARGINANSRGAYSPISIINSGNISVSSVAGFAVRGIYAAATGILDNDHNPISIVNSGDIEASTASEALGIAAMTFGADNPISINNSGALNIRSSQNVATGYLRCGAR